MTPVAVLQLVGAHQVVGPLQLAGVLHPLIGGAALVGREAARPAEEPLALPVDLASNVNDEDRAFAESIGTAFHLDKIGADGMNYIGDNGCRGWDGGDEVTDAMGTEESVLGGGDFEVCVLSELGAVSCYVFFSEVEPVDVNEDFACAVRVDGEVACWGGSRELVFENKVRLD